MLKLGSISKNRSLRIKLPEHWHSKILEFTSSIQFPYNFILESVEKNKDHNEVYYIFHSKKNQKLVLTEHVLKYFFGKTVEDSNVGLCFSEYLQLKVLHQASLLLPVSGHLCLRL